MLLRLAVCALLAMSASAGEIRSSRDPETLVVHEWGTFTSVAGDDGEAMSWLPLQSQDDLPCFVDRYRQFKGKFAVRGTVRMETPVLYFYAARPTTVDVSVRFPNGLISEWFPRASVTPTTPFPETGVFPSGFAGSATWRQVRVLPGATEDFTVERRSSHYYAARATDAAPIEVAGAREKFLFYRGVADVKVPLAVTAGSDGVHVASAGSSGLGTVLIFERRGDHMGFEVRTTRARVTTFVDLPLTDSVDALTTTLEAVLTKAGLYPREAAAMVNTWRDSWFEEGTRILYVVPEAVVDAMLPLDVNPRPASVARVFVGRIEVMTRETRKAVTEALRTRNATALQRYGRFLLPISERVLADPAVQMNRAAIQQFIYGAFAAVSRGTGCS